MAFTFFMRDQPTLEHAADHMISYASGRSKIKIWDAGCALGQETYTIAMIFAQKMNQYGFRNLHIDATDYDSANNFGDVVSAAIYPNDELQRTPAELLHKYFEPSERPGHQRAVELLRKRVFFQYHDLLSLKPIGGDFCLVVCKNVMLHFQYPERVEVFRMFHQALAPGGVPGDREHPEAAGRGGASLHPGGSGLPALQESGGVSAMHIVPLQKTDKAYSCNSYLVLGDWNRIEDLNTVIDPGTDDFILAQIERISTGFGKVAVEQVILTHNHFDHNGGVLALKQRYGARVLAFVDGPGVDELIRDGQFIRAGDDFLEVIHTPGHSSDSICLYAPQAQAVFSGDTQLRIRGPSGDYPRGYLEGLEKLSGKKIQCIYSGHDEPVTDNVQGILRETVALVNESRARAIDPS